MLMLYVLFQVLMQNLYNKKGNLPVESVCLINTSSVKSRTPIWMERTLNFVNDHWGRKTIPYNVTQTHSIFIKLQKIPF